MALFEDLLKGNLAIAAAVGGAALLVPKLLPHLSPPVRSALKSGLQLFLEAESEAEGGIVNRLAEQALKNVLEGLSRPGSEGERMKAGEAAIDDFKRTARKRAQRGGWDDPDRDQRYRRHIAALQRGLDHARVRHPGGKAAALGRLSTRLTKPDHEEATVGAAG